MGKNGDGFQYDCAPAGSASCEFARASAALKNAPEGDPKYGFYCYNVWAYFLTMSNHLRCNNDTEFMNAKAATSNLTVDQLLEAIPWPLPWGKL
jgi:hypothetical protein